jgi:hypothetical protein
VAADGVGRRKTLILYTIMITGSIWEKVVFGKYLFARPSSGKTCSACWCWRCTPPTGRAAHRLALDVQRQMLLALAAYATYVINATQFLLKLRAARLSQSARVRFEHRGFGMTTIFDASTACSDTAAKPAVTCSSNVASMKCSAA